MSQVDTLSIRESLPTDVEVIAKLHTISWQAAYKNMLSETYLADTAAQDRLNVWKDRFNPKNKDSYKIWLAYLAGMMAGFICLVVDADSVWGTLIDNLHIHPTLKGTGIGRALMQQAVSWIAKNRPDKPVHLFVYEGNEKACSFYEKLGGQMIERELALRADGQFNYSLKYVWYHPEQLAAHLD